MGLVYDRNGYTGVSQLHWLPESVIRFRQVFDWVSATRN